MTRAELILKAVHEGREWLKLLLPALITWHMNPPRWMRKKADK